MTDRTAPSSDARKRNRDMADAHATARARDTRASTVTYEVRIDTSGFQRAIDRMAEQVRETAPTRREAIQRAARAFTYCTRTHAIDPDTGEFTPLTQESDMTDHRADAERALSSIDASDDPRNLPAGLDGIGRALLAIHGTLAEIRDRLPERTEVKVAPFDPDLVAANIAALKHELETPMREHGECCEPAPADDLPGEPVEPGDLRAGDKVEFTWDGERITCTLVSGAHGSALLSDTPDSDGFIPGIVGWNGRWAGGISDVRLIERAPRGDEGRDEAEKAALVEEGVRQKRRAIKAETERDEWREVAARYADGRDKWQAKWRESEEARERVEAERDALRERLDALREDVERFSAGDPLITPLDILARDDERAAKGEQR